MIILSKKLIRCKMIVSGYNLNNNLNTWPCYKILKYHLKSNVLVRAILKNHLVKKKEM